jgi:prophage regulatory protein
MPAQQPFSLLRLPQVVARVGLSRATIYSLIGKGLFPKPIPLSQRSVAWLDSEIDGWISNKISSARGGAQ